MASEQIQQTFTVPASARLTLSNIRGSVSVEPGEDGNITVTAVKLTDTGDAEHTEVRISQADDGGVKAETLFPRKDSWWFLTLSRPCAVEYTVKVPRTCTVKVSGVSSSTSLQGLSGDLHARSVSGAMQLNHLSGAMRVNTVSGDITGDQLSGKLHFETVSGDIQLAESELASVEGSTVSGDVHLHTPLAEGPYDFRSVSGDIRLYVPTGTCCTAEASAVSGRIVTSLPPAVQTRFTGKSKVEILGGGPKVRLHSVSGNLWIGSTENETAEARPVKPAPASRVKILQQVERGEMSVEEALAQLRI
jgi:hypothetical protein